MQRLKDPMRLTPASLRGRVPLLCMALCAATLAACASNPTPPTDAIQAAELAIEKAEDARIADYMSPELGEARDKLVAAREAVQKEDMGLARRLAEQARADAELATAKAEVNKAKAVNEELSKTTETMKQEMQRNPGVQ